jgi:hypothetical protein
MHELLTKMTYYEQILNEAHNFNRDSIESLKNKIFILENVIIKKDNLILSLQNKLQLLKDREYDNIKYDKELYVF